MIEWLTQLSWAAVAQIVLIDILLGGDNAVVIALACRNLPKEMRTKGILWGTAGAILLRIVLVAFAVTLLKIPALKLIGGLLLLWIGIKLLLPEPDDGHGNIQASDKLVGAIKTIIVADLVMSLDNVIAIAGAAEHAPQAQQLMLIIFGLLVSIPIIIWGSQLVLKLLDRFRFIIVLGAALLGWIAGGLIASDILTKPYVDTLGAHAAQGFAAIGALVVVGWGTMLARRRTVQ